MLTITPIYAAILALLFFYLSVLVIKQRRIAKVGLGDGNHKMLTRAIAAHNNFAQYVPICLILLGLLEINHTNHIIIHLLGASLISGRSAHAYGISQEPEKLIFRQIGMLLTFGVIIVAALYLLISAFLPLFT